MNDIEAAYQELYVYTMGRPNFILQHVVDAHQAQTATENSKAIGLVFSLVGLYLHVEKGYSGVQVQQIHQKLARQRRQWPTIRLPRDRGTLTPRDVMAVDAGPMRDAAIGRWCEAVWSAFADSRQTIVSLLVEHRLQ